MSIDFSRIDKAAFSSRKFGKSAIFTPATGELVSCLVQLNVPIEASAIGVAGISAENIQLLVRRSEVSDPHDGVFSNIEGRGPSETFRVAAADLDIEGITWTCQTPPL